MNRDHFVGQSKAQNHRGYRRGLRKPLSGRDLFVGPLSKRLTPIRRPLPLSFWEVWTTSVAPASLGHAGTAATLSKIGATLGASAGLWEAGARLWKIKDRGLLGNRGSLWKVEAAASLTEVVAPSGARTGLWEAGPHQRLWSVIPRGRRVLMNFSTQGNRGTVSLLSHFPIPFV